MHCSYGVIPLKRVNEKWSVFLVQIASGNHWGFPKGHPEDGEEPKATALRELSEETALQIDTWLAESPIRERYEYQNNSGQMIEKEVCYFLALVQEGRVSLQEGEVLDGQWVSLPEALHTITYEASRKVCEKVISIMENKA